jgi:hypothetical protein
LAFKLPDHIVSQRGENNSNFLIENFTEFSQKSAKLVQFTLGKKIIQTFFKTFVKKKKICPKPHHKLLTTNVSSWSLMILFQLARTRQSHSILWNGEVPTHYVG